MKTVILLFLCAGVLAFALPPFMMFQKQDISNTEVKNYFVSYVHSLNGMSIDELRTHTPKQIASIAIESLLKRLGPNPHHTLIRQHIDYFVYYVTSPVPDAPFIEVDKDLSKLPDMDLRDYLIGYLHALSGISEHKLSYKSTPELIDLILGRLNKKYHKNSGDPQKTALIQKHFHYFQRLKM